MCPTKLGADSNSILIRLAIVSHRIVFFRPVMYMLRWHDTSLSARRNGLRFRIYAKAIRMFGNGQVIEYMAELEKLEHN